MRTVWKVVGIIAVVLFVLGLALIVASLLTGGGLESIRNNVNLTGYEESFEDAELTGLELRVGAGELHVLRGDVLRVEAKNILSDGFVCRLEQGVLTVEEKWSSSWSDNLSRWLNLRGKNPEIYVYLPEDVHVRAADIQVSAGNCTIESLSADRATLHTSAGRLSVQELSVGQAEVKLSAGSVVLSGLNAQSLDVDISAGSVDVSGAVALACTVDVSAGSAQLYLTGSAEDYTADIDAGAGSISYGGRRFSMGNGYVGSGAGMMELDCSAGSISVRFSD